VRKLGIFVGRFQPLHLAHEETLRFAMSNCDHLIVFLGSAGGPRTTHNPFTADERKEMIESVVGKRENVTYIGLKDHPYDNKAWLSELMGHVSNVQAKLCQAPMRLFGHDKDQSSFYLKLLQDLGIPLIKPTKPCSYRMDATTIRENWIKGGNNWEKMVQPQMRDFMKDFSKSFAMDTLRADYKAIRKYRQSWSCAPYQPNHTAVDALVSCGSNILLIHRGKAPGAGLLALPGGFLNTDERLLEGVRRELREETGLNLDPVPHRIIGDGTFDYPQRDQRARIISHTLHVAIDLACPPVLKAADDAQDLVWIPIRECFRREHQFYADHLEIVRYFFSKETA
jgi:bifunctional NMN adenylyltransferase/nudix hydrolase